LIGECVRRAVSLATTSVGRRFRDSAERWISGVLASARAAIRQPGESHPQVAQRSDSRFVSKWKQQIVPLRRADSLLQAMKHLEGSFKPSRASAIGIDRDADGRTVIMRNPPASTRSQAIQMHASIFPLGVP
jgi:hypothetical protein